MRALAALVVRTLSAWVRPRRTQAQAWTSNEPEGSGRFVFHAVVTRPNGHVWGRGWFASRAEARAALADLVAACRKSDWGLRNSSIETAKVVRTWRGDAEQGVYGGDWHARVTDLSTPRKTIGKLPR